MLSTLPLFLQVNTASAGQEGIPNPHQYRYASIGLGESLDPGWAYDDASGELILNVYEPLIAYDHESVDAFVPLLAKALPKVEKATERLTNTTAVNMANPVDSYWIAGGVGYYLFGWRDKDASGDLTVGDFVWFENLPSHEHSFHGVVKGIMFGIPSTIALDVERVRIYFELRQNVHFQPWTHDMPGWEQHTADLLTTEDVEFTFERNCVLDHEGGPMHLTMKPTLDIYTTREYDLSSVENRTLVGHMIDNAFAHNNTHFWINLVQMYAPFVQIITQYWCSIMNKAWIIALQEKYIPDPTKRFYGFDVTTPRDWASWYGYTNPPPPSEIDADIGHMCGTGPYYFETRDLTVLFQWWRIRKYDATTNEYGYWGGWPAEGRHPEFYLDTVINIDYSADPGLAVEHFLSNDTEVQLDSIDNYYSQFYSGPYPGLEDEPGVRTWTMPLPSVTAFLMGYDPEETSIYLPQMPPGTNKHDFFSDPHMRKAFAHLVPHEYVGEAILPNSIIVSGVKYHNPDQQFYQYDLNEALREFKLAWGGMPYTLGFKVILIYALGNLIQQKYCEMLEYVLEVNMKELDPTTNFHADVIGLNWSTVILPAIYTYQLASWMAGQGAADYPDADPFARAFIHPHEGYGLFQRIQYGQSGMKQKFWNLTPWCLGEFGNTALVIDNNYVATVIDKAVRIDDSTIAGYNMRKQMYFHLQEIYYQEVPGYAFYQPLGRRWERNWVQGWYYNPISPYGDGPGGYFYHMWKAWCCPGDLDFRQDLINGHPHLNYLTCDFLDLFKFRGYYLMPKYIPCSRMRYADYNCDKKLDYLDLFRFRNYYINYCQWSLCPGPCRWPWPPPPY